MIKKISIEKKLETIKQELKGHLEKQEQLVYKGHQAPKMILVQQEQEVHKVYKVKEENKENQEHQEHQVLTKYYQQTCIITQVMKSRFLDLTLVFQVTLLLHVNRVILQYVVILM